MNVNIEISNRHIHLSKEVYDMLFNDEMNKVRELSQKGEFVSDKVLTIESDNGKIENVKVLGPLRSYTQVEISRKDSFTLKVNPPVRASGDLLDASEITLVNGDKKVKVNGLIIAQRHLHINSLDAKKLGLNNKDVIGLKVGGERSGIMDIHVKVSDNATLMVHIDTDEANAFGLNQMDEGKLVIYDVKNR